MIKNVNKLLNRYKMLGFKVISIAFHEYNILDPDGDFYCTVRL